MCWKNNVKIKKIDTNSFLLYIILLYYIIFYLRYICCKQAKRKTRHRAEERDTELKFYMSYCLVSRSSDFFVLENFQNKKQTRTIQQNWRINNQNRFFVDKLFPPNNEQKITSKRVQTNTKQAITNNGGCCISTTRNFILFCVLNQQD